MTTVAVLGAGRIGKAVLAGLKRSGWPAEDLLATARRPERAAALESEFGIQVVSNSEAVKRADITVIAVKPQDAEALLEELAPSLSGDNPVVSLCAGLPTTFFEKRLPDGTPVVRAMTNTPALVEEAVTVISAGKQATEAHLRQAEQLFQPLGHTLHLDESHIDAVTALSGSGPAYFYYLVEGMIDAAILMGLPRSVAQELIVQTATGAAAMLRDTGEHPVQLREAVTSPAGTTINAVRELERHRVRAAILDAAEAARDRAREIAGEYS
ncbi:pyrroline-5-carboxylate reductase [Natronoglycomyces albus]|uniref:Pyrroline-5-carboxylate reductase n=1 Tax=Natronoglycomyces albus TaxID=2811108 RepID=A0A895XSQ1_9ACTN|nr:pyrroline-5-carboxylate reductase [Natronoglycomyces albus]QSB06692.1 pyrroline-5-carboxylate reductase [Natronoglycomyces albus]